MDINLFAVFIAQYKIPRSCISELYLVVTLRLQQVTEHRNILLLNGNVQVRVRPGLLTEQRINAPPTVDPQFDAQLRDGSVEINDIY